MSVGRRDSPCRLAWARDQWRATRPAARYTVANAHGRRLWAERSAGSVISSRRVSTAIAASAVEVTTPRRSSRMSARRRGRYIPRTAPAAMTRAAKSASHTGGALSTPAAREPSDDARAAASSIPPSSASRASDQATSGRTRGAGRCAGTASNGWGLSARGGADVAVGSIIRRLRGPYSAQRAVAAVLLR